jgi:MoaA/NifB/PqqE/SkfB family radical SAM enzyme/predicted dehydrogenase
MSSTETSSTVRRPQRSAQLHAGGECDLRCAICDCTAPPSSPADVARTLEGGGGRLVVRGATERSPLAGEIVARAREHGYTDIVLRTNATGFQSSESAASFSRLGATAAMVPFFSQFPAVHDRIAGRPRALLDALTGIRHLVAAGLAIEIEIPVLQPRLQNLEEIVRLVRRAAPTLRAVRLFLPSSSHPVLAPPSWDTAAPAMAAALRYCRGLDVRAVLSTESGVPLCALRDHPDLHDAYAINPKARSATRGGATLGEVCRDCAVRAQCPGITPSYRAVHGEAGLAAYTSRPKAMYEQRTTRSRQWTDEQRAAAARSQLLVLRPTVNCNQDCTFCSANETSANVWANHDEMLRAIARAARRGIDWLSFSGGEPTLSKHLVAYIRSAARLGIARREIVTNAVLLDRKEKVAALVEAGLTDAFVSLHAHDEALSRQSTQKVGDFPRTVAGIKGLVDAGVRTALNHVITARNYQYLSAYVEFVHREFGGRVKISFAFVTPQFKALDNIDVMPRLSDVMPHLKRALYRALELGQPFAVGSRQGIPFCFLDEFRAWSDGLKLSSSALSEDGPQKQRAAACDDCRFSDYCPGLWRPYAAQYGFDELRPVAGPKLSEREVQSLEWLSRLYPWGEPMSFDEVSTALREPTLETGPPEITAPPAETSAMPQVEFQRSRPLRVLMIGSGRQARRLASAARGVPGLSIDAVASPHAPQADTTDFGDCPAYADVEVAIDDIRPEAVIIAAATAAHAALARLAVARGIPVLLEKPIASSEQEARSLCEIAGAGGATVVPAHNTLHTPGLQEFLSASAGRTAVTYTWRRTRGSGDTMRTWNRSFLYESLHHLLAVVGRGVGGGVGEVIRASYRGEGAPESLRVELDYGGAPAEITIDFAAAADEDAVSLRDLDVPGTEREWRRSGREVTIREGAAVRTVESRGSDAACMLANFRDVVLGTAPPATTLDDALDVMRTAAAAVDAIAAAGAPFERRTAPRHVASPELRQPVA